MSSIPINTWVPLMRLAMKVYTFGPKSHYTGFNLL